jgi:hypothetical protein
MIVLDFHRLSSDVENINPIAVAKGISDYGFMAVTAAFFLVIAGSMLWIFIRWFIKIINNIMETKQTIVALVDIQKETLAMIKDIHENTDNKLLEQIHVISGMAFDNAKFLIFRALMKIREENHLEDNEEIIEKKIQLIVENIHNDRNSKFDNFNYRGARLSEYVNEAWIRRIVNLMLTELYSGAFDAKRAMSNIDLAYQSFKVEFYKNLTKK